MPRDGVGDDLGAGRPQTRTPRDEVGGAPFGDVDAVGGRQPGQQTGGGVHRFGGWRLGGEVADEADQEREALRASGGVSLHRRVEAALAALPQTPIGVDEEVVGDIGPALLVRVVVEETPDACGDLFGRIPVRGG